MNFDEVKSVLLQVILDWRVLIITIALLVYLVILVFVSSIRKKAPGKGLLKSKIRSFKMPTIKMPKKKAKTPDGEESDSEDAGPSAPKRPPVDEEDDEDEGGGKSGKKDKKSKKKKK